MGETKRNVETRWNKHENPNKVFEPAKHLRDFPNRKFNWEIHGTYIPKICKILESSMTALKRLSLKEQLNFDQLILFRNGLT